MQKILFMATTAFRWCQWSNKKSKSLQLSSDDINARNSILSNLFHSSDYIESVKWCKFLFIAVMIMVNIIIIIRNILFEMNGIETSCVDAN